jgi:hypothetical protein
MTSQMRDTLAAMLVAALALVSAVMMGWGG